MEARAWETLMEKNNQVDNAKDVTVTQGFLSSVGATCHIQPKGKERLYAEGDFGIRKQRISDIYTHKLPPPHKWFTRKFKDNTAILKVISGFHTSCWHLDINLSIGVLVSWLSRWGAGDHVCGTCWFPWCIYCHLSWLQAKLPTWHHWAWGWEEPWMTGSLDSVQAGFSTTRSLGLQFSDNSYWQTQPLLKRDIIEF